MSVTTIASGPGVDVSVVAGAPSGASSPPGAGAFFVGLAETGPANTPTLITSVAAYRSIFGSRSGAFALLSDSVEAMLGESNGAGSCIVCRGVGPAATVGSLVLPDSTPATTLTVKSLYDTTLSVNTAIQVTVSGSTFTILVFDLTASSTVPVETWGPFGTNLLALAAVNGVSRFISLVDAGLGTRPVVKVQTPLSAGTGDETSIADAGYQAALDAIPANLGPGQVAIPGTSTAARHAMVMAHAVAKGRYALLDAADQATSSAIITLAGTDAALPGVVKPGDSGAVIDHWFTLTPAPGSSVPRHVPGSAVLAGRIAATDVKYGHSAEAAAGADGEVIYATGLSGPAFDFATRQLINASKGVAGAITCRGIDGTVPGASPLAADPTRIYGWRNTSADPQWYDAAPSRERMSLAWRIRQRGEQVVFRTITKRTLADLANLAKTELEADLRAGALDDNAMTPPYTVDVGPTVNTDATKALGRILCAIGFTPPHTGEHVHFNLTVNV